MENMVKNNDFWQGKKVLITGHTGFKGTWLSLLLKGLGAKICGVSLPAPTNPSLFDVVRLKEIVDTRYCDIRNFQELSAVISEFKPEIIFHLAAQPLVGYSYKNPIETYTTNVIGTLNVLESIRYEPSVMTAIMVTTDKCYKNNEWIWGYRESDRLGGHDPYSSSKAAAEILIQSYRQSFFENKRKVGIASVRAGNVVGGGDWADDRLIPDIFRAIFNNRVVKLRNPQAIRPWQHVLDPLNGYIKLAEFLYNDADYYNGPWNFGPNYIDSISVGDIINRIKSLLPIDINIHISQENNYKETSFLKLDCTKAQTLLKWRPVWDIETALQKVVDWYMTWNQKKIDMREFTLKQINQFYMNAIDTH